MTAERGLQRMQQIAREETAAVRTRDADTLCRLTELIPNTVEGLRQSGLPASLSGPETETVLNEIRHAHEQAERYLEEQLRSVRLLLQQCSTARRTLRAYGKRTSAANLQQIDNRS